VCSLRVSILQVLRDILDEQRKLPVIEIIEVIISGVSAGIAIAVVPGFTAKLKQLCGKKVLFILITFLLNICCEPMVTRITTRTTECSHAPSSTSRASVYKASEEENRRR
jgi:hypothetical protein